VSKKRPRAAARAGSKQTPEYWHRRLFKGRYTYNGQQCEVRNWSVKIQHSGRRKTLALRSSRRKQAAVEACELYQTLVTQGWETVTGPRGRRRARGNLWSGGPAALRGDRLDAGYWAQRLIHREYTMNLQPAGAKELSVRVEHAGTGHYFPLGTDNEKLAAKRALRIYQTIVDRGWEVANKRFRRELTVAFHWFDIPLAWTYTTVHTLNTAAPSVPPEIFQAGGGGLELAIAESDAGIRRALEWCVRHMDGVCCAGAFGSAGELLRESRIKPVHLALVSQNLADMPGTMCLERLKVAAPKVSGLLYSIYEDSEELFRGTPGGAGTYLLRRTPATQLLEPLTDWLRRGRALGEEMVPAAWQYFKDSIAAVPVGSAALQLAHLTQREQEVLASLSKGHPDKDIADQLGISIHTVHEHLKNIFDKLGAHNRTEAVVKFLQK
jgi:DNA-binding NarL/FixJ family response regulator